jgi:DnaJ-class molecular chaperone
MVRKAKEENLGEMPTSINPYEVLGVEDKATADQIKSAYRKQALKHHPGQHSWLSAPIDFYF